MGIIQMGVGALKQGRLIRMVPYPVMLGFVNGLAIVIFLAQLESFKTEGANGRVSWLPGGDLAIMLGLVAVTMTVLYVLPRFTKLFPAALAGILLVSGLVIFWGLHAPAVGDLSSILGGTPAVRCNPPNGTGLTLKNLFQCQKQGADGRLINLARLHRAKIGLGKALTRGNLVKSEPQLFPPISNNLT